MKRSGIHFFIVFFLCTLPAFAEENDFMHVEYYLWSRLAGKCPGQEALSHMRILYYFKAEPDPKGKITLSEKYISGLKELKKMKQPGTEIWIGIGSLKNVSKDETALETFIKELREICKKHGFSGVDIDWEGQDIDNNDYRKVVTKISGELRKKDKKKIAISVGPGDPYTQKVLMVNDFVDFVNVQCYYSTTNAWPAEKLFKELEKFRKEAKLSRSKMIIGLPLYGSYDAHKYKTEGWIPYRTMIEKGADPNKNIWIEPETKRECFYSGLPLIKEKTRLLKEKGYRGVFSWEISTDLPYSSEYSILRAIDEAVAGK